MKLWQADIQCISLYLMCLGKDCSCSLIKGTPFSEAFSLLTSEMNAWKRATYMNLHKDARLLKMDHISSRGKTIINTVCLITVSRHYDRDPDPSVAIVGLAVLSSLEIARFPCCSAVH